MSLQIDLAHPDLGYFDERLNLTEEETYRGCLASLGRLRSYLQSVSGQKFF